MGTFEPPSPPPSSLSSGEPGAGRSPVAAAAIAVRATTTRSARRTRLGIGNRVSPQWCRSLSKVSPGVPSGGAEGAELRARRLVGGRGLRRRGADRRVAVEQPALLEVADRA